VGDGDFVEAFLVGDGDSFPLAPFFAVLLDGVGLTTESLVDSLLSPVEEGSEVSASASCAGFAAASKAALSRSNCSS